MEALLRQRRKTFMLKKRNPKQNLKVACVADVYKGWMTNTKNLIEMAYAAFNQRDVDAALALMTADVSWPKASEGGKVIGKEAIRAYWTRQWNDFDPHVEPLTITEHPGGKVHVTVHQVVKSLQGDVLADGEVLHVFTVHGGLIAAMALGEDTDADAGPSSAFRA